MGAVACEAGPAVTVLGMSHSEFGAVSCGSGRDGGDPPADAQADREATRTGSDIGGPMRLAADGARSRSSGRQSAALGRGSWGTVDHPLDIGRPVPQVDGPSHQLCPRGDLNPYALKRALAPQASASTNSATRTGVLAGPAALGSDVGLYPRLGVNANCRVDSSERPCRY